MERLASLETNPNIHYHPVFVGEETKAIDHSSNNSTKNEHQQVINRLATIKAKKLANYNQIKEQFNSGQKIVLSNDMIRLDEFIDKSQHFDIDFLKVDTDGHDINVLRGASSIINSGGMIGLDVEVRFIGPQNNHANIFRNVDKMLSDAGYSLFHLEPKKYSRSSMPRVFTRDKPSISPHGQVRWANSIYLRDLGAPGATAHLPLDKVLKAICIFDLFDLPDVSAEIVMNEEERLSSIMSAGNILNKLTPDIGDIRNVSYSDYIDQFEKAARSRRFFDFGRVWID